MPGRPPPVPRIDADRLLVSVVRLAVVPPVTEVHPSDERDVALTRPPDHHDLLVMAATTPHALVEEHLPSHAVHDLSEVQVLLLTEVLLVRMRPPHEPPHVAAPPAEIRQYVPQFGTGPGQPFVGVATPVREQDEVAGAELPQAAFETAEVLLAVDEDADVVPGRPREPVGVSSIDGRVSVPSLAGAQEPRVR